MLEEVGAGSIREDTGSERQQGNGEDETAHGISFSRGILYTFEYRRMNRV